MAIQGFFTGDVKIRDLNGVLKAVDGVVEVATDAGTVTSVGLQVGTSGTDVNVANSPITSSGNITLNLPTASATNRGLLSSADWEIFSAKQGAITLTTTGNNGSATLTSGTLNIPTYTLAGLGGISLTSLSASSPLLYNNTTGAFSIQVANGSQNGYLSSTDWITFNSKQDALSGTGIVKSTGGTISYITDNSNNWNTAYNDSIVSAAVSGTSTKTLTLTQQDGGTVTASWSDADTGLTSVGVSMPSAFSVSNSPLTSNGTIAITGAGVASQYVRGDGTLANFPNNGGGGSSVSYYLNGSVNQGTFGGNTYYEMNKVPIIGTGTDFSISADGYIAQFITDAGDPALLNIPAGNWNFEMYFNSSSSGGTPSFYIELYKYNGSVFTLISSGSATPELITGGTAIDLYTTALAVPSTSLTITDRLAIRVYVTHSGKTITLHTEDNHLCQVITTFSTGITALNGLTEQVQYFQVGTSGTDFNISSATATHTFNLPTASATNRGALSSTDWTTFNNKQNALTNPVTGTGTTNTLPKFTGASTIGNSNITDTGSLITLGSDTYINGNVGIGSTPFAGYSLYLGKGLSGSSTSVGVAQQGIVASTTTTEARSFDSFARTAATSFTLVSYIHYKTQQATLGAGSAITNQYGFWADSSLTGATNNFGFYGNIASGTGRWNLYMNGTANNYMAGNLGIGGFDLDLSAKIQSWGDIGLVGQYNSALNIGNIYTVSNRYGSYIQFTGAGDFTSSINFYTNGSASNIDPTLKMTLSSSGSLGIGTTSLTGITLNIAKNLTGATASTQVFAQTTIQSDVTGTAIIYNSFPSTQAAAFTLTNLYHYQANQSSIGATSAVTTQIGFRVSSSLTGATNNFGFRGELAAASNVWNLYMNGTAANYLAGNLLLNTTTDAGFRLDVNGTARVSGELTVNGVNIGLGGGAISSNTRVGANALNANTTGSFNAAFGSNALRLSTTSSVNSAFGAEALENTTGVRNSAFGSAAMQANTSGSNNIAFGRQAGRFAGSGTTPMTSVDNSIYLGFQTRGLNATGTTNEIVIGYDVVGLGSNTTVLGNTSTVTTAIYGDLLLGTTTTSATKLTVGGSETASSAIARGQLLNTTLVAAANNDVLVGLDINPTFTNGAFTGVQNLGLRVLSNVAFGAVGTGMYWDNTNGRLGIGTNSPFTNVDIVGPSGRTTFTGTSRLGLTIRGSVNNDEYNGIDFLAGSGTTNPIGRIAIKSTTSGSVMEFGTSNAYANGIVKRMIFDQAGRFAVNSGAVSLLGYTALFGDGTETSYHYLGIKASATDLYIGQNGGNNAFGLTGIFTTITSTASSTLAIGVTTNNPLILATNNVERLRIFANGNIGINTGGTDAGFRLDVNGTARVSGQLTANSFVPTSSTIPTNGMYLTGTNTLGFATNSTLDMVINEVGSVGIGTTALAQYGLRASKNITGATIAYGITSDGIVQSDVTNQAHYFSTNAQTTATTFTTSTLFHYRAIQGTFGAGSTVTAQHGFFVDNTLIGATNNFGFYGNIASGTNRWNLYMNGTANNYMAGTLGIGTTSITGYNLRVGKNLTGAATSYGVTSEGAIQSDVTNGYYFRTFGATQATAFALNSLNHFQASQSTIGSGSTVANQYGFTADATLVGATNNYGFYGNIAAASNVWNLYMNGTANNYMAGRLGIGTTSLTTINLRNDLNITGGTSAFGTFTGGVIQSDVTSLAVYFRSNAGTQATAFTLNDLIHFSATQATIGATSTVTNQYGFRVESSLTGATNNYGFFGNIASGTNRWNLYMNGTANNYLAGVLNIGTTTLSGFTLDVNGTARVSGQLTANSFVPTSSTIPTNGMYLSGTNTLGFATNSTQAMTLDASGRLGIGTSSPDRLLTVYADNSATTPIAKIQNAGTGDAVTEYRVTGASWYVGIDNSDSDKFKIGQDPLGTSDRFIIADGGAATFTGDVKVKTLEITNATTYGSSSGISTYMQITVNGQNYVIPLHGTP